MDPALLLFYLNSFSMLIMAIYALRHYIYSAIHVILSLRPIKNPGEGPPVLQEGLPRVSILIPAHNEENVIGGLLKSLVTQDYPKELMEVIVINDGSTDKTGDIAKAFAKRFNFVKVVDIYPGGNGKAQALNIGLEHAKGDVILVFDADYVPMFDCVRRLVENLMDGRYGVVQGNIIPYNHGTFFSKVVRLERLVGYELEFPVRDALSLFVQYGGTVGGFRREVIERVGKWRRNTLAEDTDLTCRAMIHGFKIKYVRDALALEQAVDNLWAYIKQRFRWMKGHIQCFFRYTWGILRSPYMTLREKVDGVLLLAMYLTPLAWLTTTIYVLAGLLSWVKPPIVESILGLTLLQMFLTSLITESLVATITSEEKTRSLLPAILAIPIISYMLALVALAALISLLTDKITGETKWPKTEKRPLPPLTPIQP